MYHIGTFEALDFYLTQWSSSCSMYHRRGGRFTDNDIYALAGTGVDDGDWLFENYNLRHQPSLTRWSERSKWLKKESVVICCNTRRKRVLQDLTVSNIKKTEVEYYASASEPTITVLLVRNCWRRLYSGATDESHSRPITCWYSAYASNFVGLGVTSRELQALISTSPLLN